MTISSLGLSLLILTMNLCIYSIAGSTIGAKLDNSQIISKTLNKDKKNKTGLERFILSVSENGYGKRSSYVDYRVTNRGGKGIIGIINSPRNGNIASTLVVDEAD